MGLLVSEVVTNAVVHAGTEVAISLVYDRGDLRFEATDGRQDMPALDDTRGDEAGTPRAESWPPAGDRDGDAARRQAGDALGSSRGLLLLDALTDRWGVEEASQGKTVWFEVSGCDEQARPAGGDDYRESPVTVTLTDLPSHLTLETVTQDDSMLREMALLALTASPGDDADGWQEMAWCGTADNPSLDLGHLVRAASAAESGCQPTFSASVPMSQSAARAANRRLLLAEEGDRLASEGKLLCPPATPEMARYRRWLLVEIIHQVRLATWKRGRHLTGRPETS